MIGEMEASEPSRLGERGMSLVEALVSSFILLILLLGIVPLFTQSTTSNLEGRESSQVATLARSRAEEFMQSPFNSEPMQITQGSERQHFELYSRGKWQNAPSLDPPLPAGTRWTRTTTIRQYNVMDLESPLPAGADPGQVHVKEVEVAVVGARPGGYFGAAKSLAVRVYKSN